MFIFQYEQRLCGLLLHERLPGYSCDTQAMARFSEMLSVLAAPADCDCVEGWKGRRGAHSKGGGGCSLQSSVLWHEMRLADCKRPGERLRHTEAIYSLVLLLLASDVKINIAPEKKSSFPQTQDVTQDFAASGFSLLSNVCYYCRSSKQVLLLNCFKRIKTTGAAIE